MKRRTLLAFGSTVVSAVAYRRFTAARKQAERALLEGSRVVETAMGPIEYGEEGSGEPLLVIHGAGGGYDQGLMIGHDLRDEFRIVAPSRFGYLRTPIPSDNTAEAQADAHLALLDHLAIQSCVVMGVSAGAPSALLLALRHPERVRRLILMSPRLFHPEQEVSADSSLSSRAVMGLLGSASDFVWLLATRFARPAVVRFLGVKPELEAKATAADREKLTALMRSIMPLSQRLPGIEVDGRNPPRDVPLEQLITPTLLISAADDLYRTLPAAQLAASRIPGAELHDVPTGGHLMVGRDVEIRDVIRSFAARSSTYGGRSPGRREPTTRQAAGHLATA